MGRCFFGAGGGGVWDGQGERTPSHETTSAGPEMWVGKGSLKGFPHKIDKKTENTPPLVNKKKKKPEKQGGNTGETEGAGARPPKSKNPLF